MLTLVKLQTSVMLSPLLWCNAMRVTITLGQRASEFVTGIPEEELSEILSDVLERSLEQQVKPVQQQNLQMQDLEIMGILAKLKEIVALYGNGTDVEISATKEDSTFEKKRDIKIDKVESSAPMDLGDSLLNMFKMLK